MSYLKILNLYKNPDIFLFKEVWADEKCHGTSQNISYKNNQLSFFAGGEKHENFVNLFNQEQLLEAFNKLGHQEITVYGEGAGGKQQGMKDTYGSKLIFVAFDVKIGDCWLNRPNAEEVVNVLGLQFIPYVKCSTDITELDRERDAPSVLAKRVGITEDKPREGIVIRPLIELRKNNGERIIAKHKGEKFRETKSPRPVDMDRFKVLEDAQKIAEEWVTPARLKNILSHFPEDIDIKSTGTIIKTMVEDVKREAGTEIVFSGDAEKAISKSAALLFKKHLQSKIGSII